jgi:hypothetical protein
VLIVAEDFVRSTRIQSRQLIDAVKDFFELAGQSLTSALLFETIKALFQGSLDSRSQNLVILKAKEAGLHFRFQQC